MSIQDEINRINQNVANTYSALSDMGATLPETQNSDNMASAVRTIPQSSGSMPVESDSVFIVNAVGSLLIDLENFIVAPSEIITVDKTVEEIIQATLRGKLVYMCFDASDSWNQQLEDDTTLTFWLPLVSSNSNSDAVFGGLYDITGIELPTVVRIMGVRDEFAEDNTWSISVTPVAPMQL